MGFARNIGSERAVLAGLLERLGLPVALVSPLLAHAAAVVDANDRLGLISPGDAQAVVARHTADSLLFALARAPRPGEQWLDVGSGAGFPGLVLACCYPSASFTLTEPHARRAGFLELQITDLGLANVTVEHRRVEQLDASFDVAVARAFTSPTDALITLKSRVRPGGLAVVAAGHAEDRPAGAELVQIADLGLVDSPGVLFMMARKA
jgi:16S rRNA (guanine527-N7)-methyltransferase